MTKAGIVLIGVFVFLGLWAAWSVVMKDRRKLTQSVTLGKITGNVIYGDGPKIIDLTNPPETKP